MGEGVTCDILEKNFCLELVYVKKRRKPQHFLGVKVILVRRAVFVLFWWVLLEPLGGDGWKALLRRFLGFSP